MVATLGSGSNNHFIFVRSRTGTEACMGIEYGYHKFIGAFVRSGIGQRSKHSMNYIRMSMNVEWRDREIEREKDL